MRGTAVYFVYSGFPRTFKDKIAYSSTLLFVHPSFRNARRKKRNIMNNEAISERCQLLINKFSQANEAYGIDP